MGQKIASKLGQSFVRLKPASLFSGAGLLHQSCWFCYGEFMEKPQNLQGFRDFLPDQARSRQRIIDTAKLVYERYGFAPLDTPALEYASLLMGKYGEDEKLIYHFKDHGDREVALRYDLTVPLARVMATHRDLPLPFKRYQIAPVWRADSPQAGRYREFVQCDVDTIGSASPLADAEIVLMMMDVLDALKITQYQVRLNHRGVMNAVLRHLDIPTKDVPAVMRQIDKLEKAGRKAIEHNLASVIADHQIKQLFELLTWKDPSTLIQHLESTLDKDGEGLAAVANLKEILALLEGRGSHYRFDLSIVRGLDYYTGLIYEVTLEDVELGSVAAGGRYDSLMSNLAGLDMPAVGISLGVDRLMAALASKTPSPPPLLFMTVFAGLEKPAFQMAEQLRRAGLPVSLALNSTKLGKQFQHANTIHASHVLLYGDEEISKGILVVRDMETGKQVEVKVKPEDELVSTLKKMLS